VRKAAVEADREALLRENERLRNVIASKDGALRVLNAELRRVKSLLPLVYPAGRE